MPGDRVIEVPGYARGTGLGGTDSVLARLTPGEIVLSIQESEAVRAAAKSVNTSRGYDAFTIKDSPTFQVAQHSVSQTKSADQTRQSIGTFGQSSASGSKNQAVNLTGNVYLDASQVGRAMFTASSTGNAITSNGSVTTNLQ